VRVKFSTFNIQQGNKMDSLDFKPLPEKKKEEILKIIKSRINEADADGLKKAMLSMDWLEGHKELVEPLMQLVKEGSPDVAMAALEGLARLNVPECETPLAEYVVALFKNPVPERMELRAECIRVLGKVGTGNSVTLMAELIENPAVPEPDKEAAVEALVSLAEGRLKTVHEKLQALQGKTEGPVREAVDCAIKELSSSDWQEKGYLTIEAEFEKDQEKS
jgi:HEAT repeat protein